MSLRRFYEENYPNLISNNGINDTPKGAIYLGDRYKVISVERFLNELIPSKQLFLSSIERQRMHDLIKKNYGKSDIRNEVDHNGELFEFKLEDVKYYQTEVGIEKLEQSKIDLPMTLVRIDNNTILYNGYHRLFTLIAMGKTTFSGKLKSLN